MPEEMYSIILEALKLWSTSGGSWLSARPIVARVLASRVGQRAAAKALRSIGRLVDIYGDDPGFIAAALVAEAEAAMGRGDVEYECEKLTIIRASVQGATGYRFGRVVMQKGQFLAGKPLLLGTRLCPPPPLPDALTPLGPIDEIMPGAYEVELPCRAGRAVAHVFANGAVTLAVPNWQCAFEAYDRLSALARSTPAK